MAKSKSEVAKNKKRPPHERAQTLSIPEAGRIYLGLGKEKSYEAAERGLIPYIEVSKKIRRVPIRAMEQLLDASATKPAETAA
jgi:hypothetical protein